MRFNSCPWLFLLSYSCFAQSTLSVASFANTAAIAMTVTSISTLVIVILPTSSNSSFVVSSVVPIEPTTSTSITTSSSTSLLLQTTPYTGQAILVGACNIPHYTALALYDGTVIEVPLVGCSDDRPECCPSLSPPESANTTTSEIPGNMPIMSIISLTATGVISMLSASPLSICPHDFIDIDPICCPSYRLYDQAIIGGITPCYSMLSTIIPLPTSVSNSIISAVAVTASATATVPIIINEVYALGLPCADKPIRDLNTGAKAGIGVGAGVGGLLLFDLLLLICVCVGKGRLRCGKGNTSYYQPPEKQMTPSTGAMTTRSTPVGMCSPNIGQRSPQFQPHNLSYGFPANQFYSAKQPHPSWASQTPSMLAQYQPPAVEMETPQRREIYEIGDEERAASPGNIDMISSAESNALNSSISAYEAQQGKLSGRISHT